MGHQKSARLATDSLVNEPQWSSAGGQDQEAKAKLNASHPRLQVGYRWVKWSARNRPRTRLQPNQVYAVVRDDMLPSQWWDGNYHSTSLVKLMARWWSKELGVHCYPMKVTVELPEAGYQGGGA
jgi:hypothetical protein